MRDSRELGFEVLDEFGLVTCTPARDNPRDLTNELRPVFGRGVQFPVHGSRRIEQLQEGRAEESLEHLRRARAADFGLQYRTRQLLVGDAYAAVLSDGPG